MFDDWDPRESDARDGDDWGIRDREEDWRDDRDRDARERDDERASLDPRDVFMRDLDLPRGRERELVHDRDRDYTLNGSDTRALSTVGAFRVVPERDLRDPRDGAFDVREKDLRRLEHEGLIQRLPLDGHDRAIPLTDRGRGLLECHRDRDSRERRAFYAGADKARERTHDAQLYRAYLEAAERLREPGARILRVELDRELKREYQRCLQDRNRGDRDSAKLLERWKDW